MTIDSTGQRANDTGWTPEAIRADKKAKKQAGRAARKAANRAKADAFWSSFRSGFSLLWDFFLRNLLLWLAIAGLIALAAWEWWNTSRGWQNLYPAAGVLTYVGAIGAIALYFFGFAQWRELGRAGKPNKQWLSVTIAAYIVCVAGVFIATATAAETAQRVAKDNRTALNNLKVDRTKVATRVELNDPELLQLQLESDQRTLAALVDTAKRTHDMPNLDMGAGCPAPPKKFIMERLCAQANGGIDPFNGEVLQGLRTQIQTDELAVKNANEAAAELAELDKQIKNFPTIQGDATADALDGMFSIDGGTALGWLLLLLSSAFLYGGGWLGDWVFERVEAMRAAARKLKAAGA